MTYPVEVRQRAFSLLEQGWARPRVAASTGVSQMAISRWREEVGGVSVEPGRGERYLSRDERYEIARLHDAEVGVERSGVGRSVGVDDQPRAPPVLARAGAAGRPARRPGYQPEACHQAALRARARPRPSRLAQEPRLREWVQARLDERYSPEQIAGRLRVRLADDEQMRISHESIYRASTSRPAAS